QQANGFPLWRRAGRGAAMWLYSGNKGSLVEERVICSADEEGRSRWVFILFILNGRVHRHSTSSRCGFAWKTLGSNLDSGGNEDIRLAGIYQLVREIFANGYPVWKSFQDGQRLLYTGSNGCWYFGGIDKVTAQDFNCSSGVLRTAVPHGGVLPHDIGQEWQFLNEEGWQLDEDIFVWSSPPKALQQLYLVGRDGSERLCGMYALQGQTANSLPLWKREGTGEEFYLYSGIDGRWHAAAKGFECDLGALSSCLHGAAMPNMLPSGAWERKLAGRYQLQDGWVNGQRHWKRCGDGEECWLYSGASGRRGSATVGGI
ncbi:unnamed protein product, partial [Durusdinium trenchii]